MSGHQCPAADCRASVPLDQLACRKHWRQLPAQLRDAVWAAWRQHGMGSVEHQQAILAALAWYGDNAPATLPGMP